MTESQQLNGILFDILKVLERIEEKLEKQDQYFENRKIVTTTRTDEKNVSVLVGQESQRFPAIETGKLHVEKKSRQNNREPGSRSDISNEIRQSEVIDAIPRQDYEVSKIRYSKWNLNIQNRDLNEVAKDILEKYTGDYWKIPNDNRLPLKLFKTSIEDMEHHGESQSMLYNGIQAQKLQRKMELLKQFNADLTRHKGNDFLVVDFDSTNKTRLYRPGKKAVGAELMVNPDDSIGQAPWSRLILFQGMTTGNSINLHKKGHNLSGLVDPVPYFGSNNKISGLWPHIFSHLQSKPRDTTMNPYLNEGTGFHITFYEIRKEKHFQLKELWKHGPLYDHPLGWFFRKSAYTLFAPATAHSSTSYCRDIGTLNRHWTILLLAPDSFYNENNLSFPMTYLDPGRAQTLGHCFGKLNQLGAEMNLIGQGLERVTGRWTEFQSFFDFILDGGDALMKPADHDNLLFDDGAFSRSRRYFWAIDCLSEFELCISDDIAQWELYKKARIEPSLTAQNLPELDFLQFKNAEKQYKILQNQREYFRQKLASTRALRDALFTASAVIESRASTRLGENVKLLTYVSVFFLPLAFCTSLWSINDMFSSTALVAVIIVVALATYITMFNVNSLVYNFGRLYDIKKRRVVRAMKSDDNETWKQRGQRFEVFRPKHENPEPSEWYITLYALLNPAVLLGINRIKTGKVPSTDGPKHPRRFFKDLWFLSLFRRKKKTEDSAINDESWVI